MRRLRLLANGDDKFQVFIPGENADYPIGTVQRLPLANPPKWKIKPYFVTLLKNDAIFKYQFDDSIEGARILVDLFHRVEEISQLEITQPYNFVFSGDTD